MCKATFATIRSKLLLRVMPKTCIYDYLHCRAGTAKVSRPSPSCPHLDSIFLNSHAAVSRKRRRVISLQGSHLFHCSTSAKAISIEELTGEPLFLFPWQKVTAGSQQRLTSHVSAKRLTATLLSPMTMAKKEFRFLYSLQLEHKRCMFK